MYVRGQPDNPGAGDGGGGDWVVTLAQVGAEVAEGSDDCVGQATGTNVLTPLQLKPTSVRIVPPSRARLPGGDPQSYGGTEERHAAAARRSASAHDSGSRTRVRQHAGLQPGAGSAQIFMPSVERVDAEGAEGARTAGLAKTDRFPENEVPYAGGRDPSSALLFSRTFVRLTRLVRSAMLPVSSLF